MDEEVRTFKEFPKESVCPLCGTNENRECILVPIDGTDHEGICEAAPTHLRCVVTNIWLYRDKQVIAAWTPFVEAAKEVAE